MKMTKLVPLTLLLLLGAGLASASAQAFFPTRIKGTFEVKFLPPAGGLPVQVSIDDQNVGILPQTVYVLPGVHRFAFSAPGEETKVIPYPVKGDTVVPSIFTAKGFPLTVNVNPPSASLSIDGRGFPGNSTTVSPGNHTLTISAPGYLTVNLPFDQPAAPHTLNIALMAATFPLTVNTNVPGAALAVDGAPFPGNATSVAPGNHTLTVMAPGYQTLTVPFVQPSASNILNVTLIANTFPLTVNTNVPGAALAIDGAPFPGNATSVTPGNHTLSVSAPGYQPLMVPFVQPSASNILNVTLIAQTGTLQVNTDRLPRTGAPFRVFVNGTEARPGPQTLTPGTYSIRVTSGNTSLETTVQIAAGQSLTLSPSVQWELR